MTEWWHGPYQVTLWIIVVVGLVAGVWFLFDFGRAVKKPFSLDAFDAGGWVVALVIVYLVGMYGMLTNYKFPAEGAQAFSRIGIGLLLDAILVARFARYRRLVWRARQMGHPQPPPEVIGGSPHSEGKEDGG